MTDAERIIDEILSNIDRRRSDEGAVFSRTVFSDQPLIQTGRQLQERQERLRQRAESREKIRQEQQARREGAQRRRRLDRQLRLAESRVDGSRPIPADLHTPRRYRQMNALGRIDHNPNSYRTPTSSRLFFEQARLMEDFEDDYVSGYLGPISLYYPSYAAMTLDQQRSYFTWRTLLRHGQLVDAPVAFAFVHAFELLCGVGTTPGEQGYRDLVDFARAYSSLEGARGTTFASRLRQWSRDYVIYHGLDTSLIDDGSVTRGAAVAVLLDAQDVTLSRIGGAWHVPAAPKDDPTPTPNELFDALCAASSYRLEASRLTKEMPEDVRSVTCSVFAALVDHCSKRRKVNFVEGLFGKPSNQRYTMFAHAVFFDPEPHQDVIVHVSRNEVFDCTEGRWARHLMCRREGTSRELGEILRSVDWRMRERLAFAHPLKQRSDPARYLLKIIDEAIDRQLERRRAEQARNIEIDLSKLRGIRTTAATTREALLVDEEREEASPATAAEDALQTSDVKDGHPGWSAMPYPAAAVREASRTLVPTPSAGTDGVGRLSETERSVLGALVDGEGADSAVTGGEVLLSVVIDNINEKLFDVVGDSVIEFDGNEPVLVGDYVDDVREALNDG